MATRVHRTLTMFRAAVTAGLLASASAVCLAQTPVPLGDQFQVNTASGFVQGVAVSADAAGNFVIVWQAYGRDGSANGVFARRYDATASPLGLPFQVNTYITGSQSQPAVAMNGSGDFVVVWGSDGQDGSNFGVFGQRYDAAGNAAGPEFRVAVSTLQRQNPASVAIAGDGSFVVVWDGYTQAGYYGGIFGRRFDSSGNALGGDFAVSLMRGFGAPVSIAMNDFGEFVVVTSGFRGRRFDASGNALGAEFPLAPPRDGERPSVAIDAAGGFVAAWHSGGFDDPDVVARAFDESGNGGGVFAVNSYTTGIQDRASVALFPSGEFVVVWGDVPDLGEDSDLFGRRFDAGGNPLGPDLRVNAYTTGYQVAADVAVTSNDTFVVAWVNTPSPTSTAQIVARRFAAPPDSIFADGFESGDLAAWSAAQTGRGDLSVSAGAGMASTALGLQAVMDDRHGVYVQDDSPNQEARYRARFYLDPGASGPREARGRLRTPVFLAFSDAPPKRQVQVVLRRLEGQYSLAAHVRRDDETVAKTGFTAITAAPHAVEIDWRRASRPGADDGALELWVDGTPVAALSGIDNDERSVDFVRLGALNVKAGASGTLWFDEFESRRTTYIGP